MFYCEDCDKKITGRGKSNKCISCVKRGIEPSNKIISSELICKECGILKNIDKFPETKNGHRRICKECYKSYLKNNWKYKNLRPLPIKDNLIRKDKINFYLVEKFGIEYLLPIGVKNV